MITDHNLAERMERAGFQASYLRDTYVPDRHRSGTNNCLLNAGGLTHYNQGLKSK